MSENSQITVIDIISKYLIDNNFDGLCGEECGCDLADLAPCESDSVLACVPGYKTNCTCGEECGWHISANKAEKI